MRRDTCASFAKRGRRRPIDRVENLEEFDNVLQEFEEEFFRGIPEAEQPARRHELLPTFIEQSSLDVRRRSRKIPI